MDAKEIISFFDLTEHPEGGYYKETYRSSDKILNKDLGDNFEGDRRHAFTKCKWNRDRCATDAIEGLDECS